jgi:alkylation response protein AidB-like acyl-CoA dehydrogenase
VLSTVSHIAVNVPPRQHAFEIADQLAAAFAQTAVERDKRGGSAKIERDLLRASGLLNVSIPADLGGWGMEWPDTMKLIRVFARVDSSIAHLFGFQHLMLASVSLYGSWPQTEELFSETVRNQWFWGNALNPLDKRTSLTSKCGVGYVINGRKSFCSGAVDSDMLIVSAVRSVDEKFMVAAIPSNRPGIRILDDWDAMGQRQTDSGTVEFSEVAARQQEFLNTPGPLGSIRASLRSCIAQLILSNIFLGIAKDRWRNRATTRWRKPDRGSHQLRRAPRKILTFWRITAVSLSAFRQRRPSQTSRESLCSEPGRAETRSLKISVASARWTSPPRR